MSLLEALRPHDCTLFYWRAFLSPNFLTPRPVLLWLPAGGNPGSDEMQSSQSVPWQGEEPAAGSGVTFRDTAVPNQLAMGRTRNTLQNWLKMEIPRIQPTLKG